MYFIQYILKASLIVKIDIGALIFLSILIWAAFLNKINRIRIMNSYADSFEKSFWSGVTLEEFYEANKKNLAHPLGIVFSGAMQEWTVSQSSKNPQIIEQLKHGTRERIMQSIEHSKIKINQVLSKYQTLLLSAVSLAPLLGLFGTICGIINTFHAIDMRGNANISVVAPGVAEALITTCLGILIALVASIMYNMFSVKIEALIDRVDFFSIDLMNILSRELDMLSISNSGYVTTALPPPPQPQSQKPQGQQNTPPPPPPPMDDEDI